MRGLPVDKRKSLLAKSGLITCFKIASVNAIQMSNSDCKQKCNKKYFTTVVHYGLCEIKCKKLFFGLNRRPCIYYGQNDGDSNEIKQNLKAQANTIKLHF
jgi:hypothetical protein